jgi:hypothetical protein
MDVYKLDLRMIDYENGRYISLDENLAEWVSVAWVR